MTKKSGFTLPETLMVVAITVMVAAMMLFSFSTYGSTEAISKDEGRVVSTLEKARSMTLDSYNSSQYGVHFELNTATIFAGTVYSAADSSNIVLNLNSKVKFENVSLAGGGSDIIFNRLSGETNQTGIVTLSLTSNATTTRAITIYATGLIQPN